MKNSMQIKLKYSGKEVDDGSMSIDDFLPVIQGFSSAYSKIANYYNLEYEQQLRITGIKKGSANILLQAWEKLGEHADQLQAVSIVGGGVKKTFETILKLIGLAKHTKKQPYTTNLSNNHNCIIVVNNDKVKQEFPIQVFNMFKEGYVAPELNKIVKPLEEDRIDELEIQGDGEKEVVLYEHKAYFETESLPATTTQEAWLTGKFNSLTKSTNRGFFILTDGTRVSYEIKAEEPENIYPMFIYKGLVQIFCTAYLDENLKPTLLEIKDAKKVQTALFDKNEKD